MWISRAIRYTGAVTRYSYSLSSRLFSGPPKEIFIETEGYIFHTILFFQVGINRIRSLCPFLFLQYYSSTATACCLELSVRYMNLPVYPKMMVIAIQAKDNHIYGR